MDEAGRTIYCDVNRIHCANATRPERDLRVKSSFVRYECPAGARTHTPVWSGEELTQLCVCVCVL